MKLIEVITARRILMNHREDKIPAATAYKIMKFMKASETEDAFYSEKLNAAIDKYCEKDEAGNPIVKANGIQIKKALLEECNNVVLEIQNTEVEKPKFSLTLDELNLFQLSVQEVSDLDAFIEE